MIGAHTAHARRRAGGPAEPLQAVRISEAGNRLVRIGAGLPNINTGVTITAWVYLPVDMDSIRTFLRMASATSTALNLATMATGTNGPAYFSTGGSIELGAGTFPVNGGSPAGWRAIALTRVGLVGAVYNGTPGGAVVSTSGAVGGPATPDEVCVGGRGDTDASDWINVRMAMVRVFDAAFTQAPIEAEWASRTPVGPGCVAFWPLNGDILDHSGNGRHLRPITTGAVPVTFEDGPPI